MAVTIDNETCIGCEACVGTCPVEALSMNDEAKAVVDEALCIDCGACIGVCPTGAITA